MVNHVKKREDRKKINFAVDRSCYGKRVSDWVKFTNGNNNTARRIVNSLSYSDLTEKQIIKRIYNIIKIFVSNGYSENDAKEFINQNVNILENTTNNVNINASVIASIIENTSKSKSDFIKSISSEKNNGSILLTNSLNLVSVYNLVFDMFISRGLSEQDAYLYLYNNMYLLRINPNSIVDLLAIFRKANLEDEVFFENPSLFNKHYLNSEINNAVEISIRNGNCSLDNIINIVNNTNKTGIIYKLSDEELKDLKVEFSKELFESSNEEYKRVL